MVAMHLKGMVINLAHQPERRQLIAIMSLTQCGRSGISHVVAAEICGFNAFSK